MKRIFVTVLIICCFVLNGCQARSIGIIGGADGPTSILVSERNDNVNNLSDINKNFSKRYINEKALPILDLSIEKIYVSDDRTLILEDKVNNEVENKVYEYYKNRTAGLYNNVKQFIKGEALLLATDNEEKNFNDGIYHERIILEEIDIVDADDIDQISESNKNRIIDMLDELQIEEFAIVEVEKTIKLNKKYLGMAPQVGDGEVVRYYLLGKTDNEYKILEVYWEGFMGD